MTKEEAVKAAAMGVPVVHMDPMTETRRVYKRISAVIWRYATLDNVLAEKSVSVELLRDDGSRGVDVYPVNSVEVVNRELWEQQKKIKFERETEKPGTRRAVFRKPSVGEVSAYAMEMLFDMDAQAFIDHYDACGWVVGKNKPMKDWKAAVRQWNRRQGEFTKEPQKAGEETRTSSFDTDEFFNAAVRNAYGADYDNLFGGKSNEN